MSQVNLNHFYNQYMQESGRDRGRADLFQIYMQDDIAQHRLQLGWRSHIFDLEWRVSLNPKYIRRVDPRTLEQAFERNIGGLFRHLAEMHMGRDLAQALRPMLERESMHIMERLEDLACNRYRGADLGTVGMGHRPGAPTEEAKKKAKALLVKHLNFEQKAAFKGAGSFKVKGKDGHLYRISSKRSFNVTRVDTGERFCGQLEDTPVEDQMLAQKLLLEHDPEKFFKNTNRAAGRPDREQEHSAFVAPPPMTATEIQRRLAERNAYERARMEEAQRTISAPLIRSTRSSRPFSWDV